MTEKAGDGSKVSLEKPICPICGETWTKNCMGVDKNTCLTGKDCKSKIDEEKQCHGFSTGSKGDSTKLGKNIFANIEKKIFVKSLTDSSFDEIDKEGDIVEYKNKKDKVKVKVDDITDEKEKKRLVRDTKTIRTNLQELMSKFNEKSVITDKEFEEFKRSAAQRNLALKESKDDYRQFHPLYFYHGGSIQAHHLICVAVMEDSKEWEDVCKRIGYNIDCRWNGVFLPSKLVVACTARIPLHRGDHNSGYGGFTDYADRVKQETNRILQKARQENPCESEAKKENFAKNMIEELKELSNRIFENIRDFRWTITSDGFDYHPNNPIGCCNSDELEKKSKNKQLKSLSPIRKDIEDKSLVSLVGRNKGDLEDLEGIAEIEEAHDAALAAFHKGVDECLRCKGDQSNQGDKGDEFKSNKKHKSVVHILEMRDIYNNGKQRDLRDLRDQSNQGDKGDEFESNRKHKSVVDILKMRGRYNNGKYELKIGE